MFSYSTREIDCKSFKIGNSFIGQYICERVFVSDGSSESTVVKIDDYYLGVKRAGDDGSWYVKHKLIHPGEVNSFLTFVGVKNTILGNVVTLKIAKTRFHYNGISTGDPRHTGMKKVQARHQRGLCDKI